MHWPLVVCEACTKGDSCRCIEIFSDVDVSHMNQNPKVSVLIPAYKAAPFIGEAIESILKQSFTDFELIVADDDSPDATWEIITHYADKDPRIVAVRNERNLGIAGNRNKLISLARGEFVMWQDADDISMPERMARQVAYMDSHPSVGIVGGYLQFFDEKGLGSIRHYAPDDVSLRANIFRYSPVAQPAAMLRKSAVLEAGEYDLRYPPADDLEMSFRIGRRYQFANLQEIVVQYRETASGATYTRLRRMELLTLEIRRKYSKDTAYRMTLLDKLYNVIHWASVYTIPPKMKIRLFNWLRNSRS